SLDGQNIDNIPTVRIMKYSELGPPPSIANDIPQQLAVAAPQVKPTVGIPVPVPKTEVPPTQTIATQQEMSQVVSPKIETGIGNVRVTQDIKIEQNSDDEPPIDKFIPVEKLPELVVAVKPAYPEMAIRASLEGTVYVKVLVDKEGNPKKAVIVKTDAELFNQPAIDAAMKSVFSPAIQNNKPVTVWVVVPFRFQIK
ncbi:MAG TPA: TonB family protein, partial [Ignavibacteriaceae bacterium]|nr:TonB family protein [Ignavibacteriaceae bacterium]